VLREHLDRLDRGEDDPVISGVEDPMRAADRGELATEEVVLLPWSPPERSSAWNALIRRADAATTAGLYHEAVERAQVFQSRVGGLLELLHREQQRVWAAEAKAEKDLSSFEDPERYRCWGEALLAGLAAATRVGEAFRVPDPYSTEGRDLLVPAEPGVSVQQAAERHFRRYRRAQRGLAQAAERSQSLRERGRRLRVLMDRFEGVRGLPAIEELEAAMRAEGIPVGLQATRRAREQARLERPRLEGVRIYSTDDGLTILVGKGARENHRLTFKLASPEDFWFHAQGHRGAHVILRNEGGLTAPPEESLRQAAAAAAWFSEARGEDRVDVQWTRRKNVRKPRSAPPGTVVIKRFRTVRVCPAEPGRGRAPA
jgi:predicted ribosome quality control (RQC) complex YloA/Tae2 family protein